MKCVMNAMVFWGIPFLICAYSADKMGFKKIQKETERKKDLKEIKDNKEINPQTRSTLRTQPSTKAAHSLSSIYFKADNIVFLHVHFFSLFFLNDL